ncbi:hypothetical protein BC830DRAFT_1102737 [Chytriomyces sp. MP71]|nr:hypothetical protein BC830DRAFT_1102737 [Chytriomyces sp. MP71]
MLVLPSELQRLVLLHLPVDRHLRSVVLSCRRLARIVSDHAFAAAHLDWHSFVSPGATSGPVSRDALATLPFAHKAAIVTVHLIKDVSLFFFHAHPSSDATSVRIWKHIASTLPHSLSPQVDWLLRAESLKWLAYCGHVNALNFLLNSVTDISQTAMHRAIERAAFSNHPRAIDVLFADPRAPAFVNDALVTAAQQGALEAVKALVQSHRVTQKGFEDAFTKAVTDCKVHVAQYLLMSVQLSTPTLLNALNTATRLRLPNLVSQLLAHPDMDPTLDGCKCIILAIDHQTPEFLKLLLAHPKISVSGRGYHAVRKVVWFGKTEMALILIEFAKVTRDPVLVSKIVSTLLEVPKDAKWNAVLAQVDACRAFFDQGSIKNT